MADDNAALIKVLPIDRLADSCPPAAITSLKLTETGSRGVFVTSQTKIGWH